MGYLRVRACAGRLLTEAKGPRPPKGFVKNNPSQRAASSRDSSLPHAKHGGLGGAQVR